MTTQSSIVAATLGTIPRNGDLRCAIRKSDPCGKKLGRYCCPLVLATVLLGACASIDSTTVTLDTGTNTIHVEVVVDSGASRIRQVEVEAVLTLVPVETFEPKTVSMTLQPEHVEVRGSETFAGSVASPFPIATCLSKIDSVITLKGAGGRGRFTKTANGTDNFGSDRLITVNFPVAKRAFSVSPANVEVGVSLRCPKTQAFKVNLKLTSPPTSRSLDLTTQLSRQQLDFFPGTLSQSANAQISVSLSDLVRTGGARSVTVTAVAKATISGDIVCNQDKHCTFEFPPEPDDEFAQADLAGCSLSSAEPSLPCDSSLLDADGSFESRLSRLKPLLRITIIWRNS